MSPPSETSTPSRRRVPPRPRPGRRRAPSRSRRGRGATSRGDANASARDGRARSRASDPRRSTAHVGPWQRRARLEVAPVAEGEQCASDRRIDEPAGRSRRPRAPRRGHARAPLRSRPSGPRPRCTRESSESSRNRLHARVDRRDLAAHDLQRGSRGTVGRDHRARRSERVEACRWAARTVAHEPPETTTGGAGVTTGAGRGRRRRAARAGARRRAPARMRGALDVRARMCARFLRTSDAAMDPCDGHGPAAARPVAANGCGERASRGLRAAGDRGDQHRERDGGERDPGGGVARAAEPERAPRLEAVPHGGSSRTRHWSSMRPFGSPGQPALMLLTSSHARESEAMRVLVVEDEPKIAALLRRGLAEEGHPTDVAASGEDALWMSEAHDYDAIVLDVMLPGIDGFETCRRMRAAGVWTPGADADRAQRDRGSRRRARRRRRRLPREAVLVRRAARPPAGAAASRHGRASERRRGGRSLARSRSPRGAARRDADRALGQGVRAARGADASRRRGALALPVARAARGTASTTTARTSSTCTSPTCATRSTGRSARGRSRRCGASATGCGPTADAEPALDQGPADACSSRCVMAVVLLAIGGVRLRARRQLADRAR